MGPEERGVGVRGVRLGERDCACMSESGKVVEKQVDGHLQVAKGARACFPCTWGQRSKARKGMMRCQWLWGAWVPDAIVVDQRVLTDKTES